MLRSADRPPTAAVRPASRSISWWTVRSTGNGARRSAWNWWRLTGCVPTVWVAIHWVSASRPRLARSVPRAITRPCTKPSLRRRGLELHAARRPPSVPLYYSRVLVTDRFGDHHAARSLIDPGSETSLIAESLARLTRTPTSVAIYGVGGQQTGVSRGRIKVTVASRNDDVTLTISALVLLRLSVYSGTVESANSIWSHIRCLELADLLGADCAANQTRVDHPGPNAIQPRYDDCVLASVFGCRRSGRSASSVLGTRGAATPSGPADSRWQGSLRGELPIHSRMNTRQPLYGSCRNALAPSGNRVPSSSTSWRSVWMAR